MTVPIPSALPPRWATSPPANTITEPSEPEKDAGFQPGSQAQVVDFTIANVLNTHAYTAQINGVLATFTSPGAGNTAATIGAGLAAAISALGQPVTAAGTANAARATANVAGQSFVAATTDGANVTIIAVTPNRSGKPIRQYVNWLFNAAYQWMIFWYYTIIGWGDVAAMGMDVPASGAAPSTSASLVGASGSAVAYVPSGVGNEVRRAVGLNEAHTYNASKDTYVSLSFDGSWNYQPVNNGGLAPTVPATARLQWVVVTSGSAITSVVDRRIDSVNVNRPALLNQPVTFGADAMFTQSAAAKYTRILNGVRGAGSSASATAKIYLADSASFVGSHNTSGGLVIAVGCQWVEGFGWRFDEASLITNPSFATVYYFDKMGRLGVLNKQVVGANSTTTWTDTGMGAGGWDQPSSLTGIPALVLGEGLGGSETDAQWPRLAAVLPAGVPRMQLFASTNANGTHRIYLSNQGASGGFTMGPCFEFVRNASWDPSLHQWVRDVSGRIGKTELGVGGGAN